MQHSTNKPKLLNSKHYRWLAIGVLAIAVYGSLIPFQFQPQSVHQAVEMFGEMSYFPFTRLEETVRSDWVISVLVFATLSYLIMGALCVDYPADVGYGGAVIVSVGCMALAVFLEFLQVYFPPRTVSWNDVVLGCAGSLIGSVLWLGAGQRITDWFRGLKEKRNVTGFARYLIPGYLVALFLLELMPFDFIISTSELGVKLDEGRIWVIPFSYRASSLIEFATRLGICFLAFMPLGVLKAYAGEYAKDRQSEYYRLLIFALAVTMAIEFLQLFVFSRYFDTTDVLLATAAILSGYWLTQNASFVWTKTQNVIRRHRLLKDALNHTVPLYLLLGAIWLVIILCINWYPFNFSTNASRHGGLIRFNWFPLADLYWSGKFQAFTQVVAKSLAFLPFGILWLIARRGSYQTGDGLRVALLAAIIATVIEVGQKLLPGRQPSMTDITIAAAAAWFGLFGSIKLREFLEQNIVNEGRVREFRR